MQLLAKAALLGCTLLACAAHASPFTFSYSFDPANTSTGGAVTVTGTFDGDEIGGLISNITNASMLINGTAFAGTLVATASDAVSAAVISADITQSDFSFYDDGSFNNIFTLTGAEAFALNANLLDAGNNALIADEAALNAHWSVAATVPEPSSYLLVALGLAAIGFVSRRRNKA